MSSRSLENPKKIKVLFRMRSLEMGGVPRMVLDLLRNLPKEIFEMTLMVNLFQGELKTEIPPDIGLIIIEKGREQCSKNKIIQTLQLALRRVRLEIYDRFPALLYVLKVKKVFDIEVACSYAEFEMVLKSPQKKSRKIGWFHTDVGYDPKPKRALHRIRLMQQFDWMIFGSQQTRQVIRDLYGISFPNSAIIYNAIKSNEIRKKAMAFPVQYAVRPTFVSIGRLHHRKGYSALIRIHKKLLDEQLYHSIVVIGGGKEQEKLQKQIKALGVEKSFILLGSLQNPWPYVKAANFFILPSQSESYPLVLGEVMALHKPIISTNVGGIPEMIIPNQDGVLVNVDEKEIFEAMKKFLTLPDWVQTLSKGASKGVQKFDEKKIYQQITQVFLDQYQLIHSS